MHRYCRKSNSIGHKRHHQTVSVIPRGFCHLQQLKRDEAVEKSRGQHAQPVPVDDPGADKHRVTSCIAPELMKACRRSRSPTMIPSIGRMIELHTSLSYGRVSAAGPGLYHTILARGNARGSLLQGVAWGSTYVMLSGHPIVG